MIACPACHRENETASCDECGFSPLGTVLEAAEFALARYQQLATVAGAPGRFYGPQAIKLRAALRAMGREV